MRKNYFYSLIIETCIGIHSYMYCTCIHVHTNISCNSNIIIYFLSGIDRFSRRYLRLRPSTTKVVLIWGEIYLIHNAHLVLHLSHLQLVFSNLSIKREISHSIYTWTRQYTIKLPRQACVSLYFHISRRLLADCEKQTSLCMERKDKQSTCIVMNMHCNLHAL